MYSHGCEEAFDELFLRHCKGLYRYLKRMTDDVGEAEDMLQETFVRVARNAKSYEPAASFKAWLYRIATNRCLSHLKGRGRLKLLAFPGEVSDEVATDKPFQQARDMEVTEAFKEAVVELSAPLRAAVVLRDLEQYTYPEAAAILDIPVGTVKTHVHRGRKILRQKLARHLREDVCNGL